MLGLLFLSDSRRHPLQFPVRAFDLALRLFLAPAIHLRQSFREPSADATQDGNRRLQVALHSGRGRTARRRLSLRFQKQFRLGQDALADHARALPPGGVELSACRVLQCCCTKANAMRAQSSRLIRAIGTRYFIASCTPSFPSRTCCWMVSGNNSTNAKRRDTQLTLRSQRRANSSSE